MINKKLYLPILISLNLLKNKMKIPININKKPENFTIVQKWQSEIILFENKMKIKGANTLEIKKLNKILLLLLKIAAFFNKKNLNITIKKIKIIISG